MNANQTIILARKHVGLDSSARLCLSDAIRCYEDGLLDAAKDRAIKSLAYSVGVFHPDYQKAIKHAKPVSSRYVMDDGYTSSSSERVLLSVGKITNYSGGFGPLPNLIGGTTHVDCTKQHLCHRAQRERRPHCHRRSRTR